MPKVVQFPTPSLFEMTEELKMLMDDLEAWAEDNEGDVSEYPFERLDKLEGEVKEKALRIAALYKNIEAVEESIAEAKKSLAAREKAHANRKERLLKYLETCLPPNAKWENAKAALSWKKNPPAVKVLVSVEELPELFLKRADPEPNKAELKARMLEYEVPVVDVTGQPLFDTENQPVLEKQLQVRWPRPVVDPLPFEDAAQEPPKEPETDYIILARMVQGRSLTIK